MTIQDNADTLTPAEFLALSKVFGAEKRIKEAKAKVEAGEYELERRITFSIRGTLKKGVDFTQAATMRLSAPHLCRAMLGALKDEGWTPQKMQAFLQRVLAEALNPPKDLDPEEVAQAKKDYDKVAKAIQKVLPQEARTGQVGFNGLIETEDTEQDFPRAAVK